MTTSRRFVPVLIATVALLVLSMTAAPAAPRAAGPPGDQGRVIPGRYIVTLDDGVDPAEVAKEYRALGAGVRHVYGSALRGFAGSLPPGLVRQLEDDPRVSVVEPDREVTGEEVQTSPPWGIDRIDQRELPLSDTYAYDATGAGVTAYVLDTGVRSTHTDFGGRVVGGYDAVGGTTTEDCHGHGTHIAGTIGGATYGVAKAVTIVPVRVLRCDLSGSWSDVIEGIDWVTAQHTAGTPAVANLSIGGSASSSGDTALSEMIADGVVAAVAAGNQSADACSYSPARVSEALTVAASDTNDQRRWSSNYGTCVDLFAPGTTIESALHSSDTDYGWKSGTSMSAPHVAGAAALLLEADPTSTPSTIDGRMQELATTGVIGDAGTGTPNRLLHVGSAQSQNAAPTAAASVTCDGVTCQLHGSGSSDPDGDIASYAWDLGDGATAKGVSASHSYAADGTYTVTLTVTDAEGATGSVSTTVKVQAPTESTHPGKGNGKPSKGDGGAEDGTTSPGKAYGKSKNK